MTSFVGLRSLEKKRVLDHPVTDQAWRLDTSQPISPLTGMIMLQPGHDSPPEPDSETSVSTMAPSLQDTPSVSGQTASSVIPRSPRPLGLSGSLKGSPAVSHQSLDHAKAQLVQGLKTLGVKTITVGPATMALSNQLPAKALVETSQAVVAAYHPQWEDTTSLRSLKMALSHVQTFLET